MNSLHLQKGKVLSDKTANTRYTKFTSDNDFKCDMHGLSVTVRS